MDYKRIFTGIVLAIIAILAIFVFNPIWFNVFIGFIILLAVYEWCNLYRWKHILWSVIYFIIIGAACYGLKFHGGSKAMGIIFDISILFWLLVAFGMIVISDAKSWRWVKQRYWMMLIGLVLLVPLWLSAGVAQAHHPFLLFYIVLCTSMTDTAAYFIGKSFGTHKMCPNISPKKTVEGMLGGIFVAECFAIALGFIFDLPSVHDYIMLDLIMFAVIILSVFGDLFESIIKRQCDVKDSSNILPGHGGVLDRIDSLIAALPVAIGLFMLVKLPIF